MKKFSPAIKPLICTMLCLAVCIAFPCMAVKSEGQNLEEEKSVLSIWQIDSFEGGKGSRADFLQKIGNDFSQINNCYVTVTTLSADSARLNLNEGNIPDIISYGAGMFGIESYISAYQTWCHGGYCILTLDSNADFSDVISDNTIINEGKDNFIGAAAMFYNLTNPNYEKSTGAYVKLINGEYKYLLGTQRDIFRLKTRGVSFNVKPITEFNDLYQNISVIADSMRARSAQKFIEYLMTRTNEVNKLGMISDNALLYDDEMKEMEGLNYEYKLTAPISIDTRKEFENIIAGCDINMLKKLLK